jgi:hypothetical protein
MPTPPDERIRLWLDDIRVPPDDSWTWVQTVEDAIALMETGRVEEASLDHDLGDEVPEGRRLVLWMAENDIWPSEAISVHSGNVVGHEYMLGVIERYSPLIRVRGTSRFVRGDG